MNGNAFNSQFDSDDVKFEEINRRYSGFFKIDEYVFQHALFEGGVSDIVKREILERGDAVAVLPYDPVEDKIVFIEQLRIGALRTKSSPWLLEVVAGMIDKPESAERVAIREAKEEAGLEINQLIPMLSYLSSPGGTSERLYLFLGIVDSNNAGGVFGLAEEQEDIKVHVLDYEESMTLLEKGVIDNAATVICMQWLALNKSKLPAKLKGMNKVESEAN